PDRLGVAHGVLEAADRREAVTVPPQSVDDGGREPVLDADGEVARVDHPAGGGEGGGGVDPIVDETGEELDLGLELAVGAHRAEHEPGPAGPPGERGHERVEGPLAGADDVDVARIEAEVGAPVVEVDPESGDGHTAAEPVDVG